MLQNRNEWKGGLEGLPFLLFCLVLLTGLPVRAADFPLTRDAGGRLLVEASFANGKSFPFVLDTGSGRSMVYRTLVAEMGFEPIPGKTVSVQTATGLRPLQQYRIGKMTALGRALGTDRLALMPDVDRPGIYGILGVDLMRGMLLEIGADHVRVVADDDPLPAGPWHEVQGRPVASGSLAVDVSLLGLTLPALVDTGANFTIVNRPAMIKLMQTADISVRDDSTGVRAAAGVMRAGTFTAARMRIGGKRYKDVRILVADLPVFAALGAARVPAMILGADIIGRQPVLLDFENWTLSIVGSEG